MDDFGVFFSVPLYPSLLLIPDFDVYGFEFEFHLSFSIFTSSIKPPVIKKGGNNEQIV